MQLFDEFQEPLAFAEEGSPDFSWTQRVFFAAYNAMKNRGGSIDTPSMAPTWLRAIDDYTEIGWHKVFIPIGPWRYCEWVIACPIHNTNGTFSGLPGASDLGDAT